MEHPVKEIPHVIHSLCEGSPAQQKAALETYFLPDASFSHPLCRVGRFSHVSVPGVGEINSRWVIWMIYRWYKILSPRIKLDVESVVYDQKHQLLYVTIHQIFSLFFVPFYEADARLVTVLSLAQGTPSDGVATAPGDATVAAGSEKFYIESQQDLYSVTEVVKFFWPGGSTILKFWQWVATLACIVGSLLLAPLTWYEQRYFEQNKKQL